MSDKSKKQKKTLGEDEPASSNAAPSDLVSLTSPVNMQDMMAQIDAKIKESEEIISQSLSSTFSLLSQATEHLGQTAQHTSQSTSQINQEVSDFTAEHTLEADVENQYQQALQAMHTAEHQVATIVTPTANQAGVQHGMDIMAQGIQHAEEVFHKCVEDTDSAIGLAIHQQQQALSQLHTDSEKSVTDAVSNTAQEPSDEDQQPAS